MNDTDRLLIELATSTAAEVARVADEAGRHAVNERDHLQPACVRIAREVAPSFEPPVVAVTQHKLTFPEWPRLGSVDLAFTFEAREPVLLELKCGSGNDALGPCVWDAAKLTFALQRNVASAAYLLAGAPVCSWQKPIRGCEFLGSGSWKSIGLRDSFGDWWRHWEKLGDPRASVLPASVQTVGLGSFPFAVGETLWELRLARLVPGTQWLEWESFLPNISQHHF